MGEWSLTIHGSGPHHNGIPADVERIGEKLVAELRAAGHIVEHAAVTIGSRLSLAGEAVLLTIKHPDTPSFRKGGGIGGGG